MGFSTELSDFLKNFEILDKKDIQILSFFENLILKLVNTGVGTEV
jgi:hypothetical protein